MQSEDITLQSAQTQSGFRLGPHARSQRCNAAGGERVNNLVENDASRRFSSQVTDAMNVICACACMKEKGMHHVC